MLRPLTLNHTLHHKFIILQLIWFLIEFDSFPGFDTTIPCPFPWFDFLLNLTWQNIGFHGASATGVACQKWTLTHPDTWSRPIWDFHLFYLLRPIHFLNLSLFFRTLLFEHSFGTFSILLYLVIPIIYLGQCGVGSYFDISIGRCEICPIGYYQGSDNKNYCDECPMASSTTGPGAMDNTSCVIGKVASG